MKRFALTGLLGLGSMLPLIGCSQPTPPAPQPVVAPAPIMEPMVAPRPEMSGRPRHHHRVVAPKHHHVTHPAHHAHPAPKKKTAH